MDSLVEKVIALFLFLALMIPISQASTIHDKYLYCFDHVNAETMIGISFGKNALVEFPSVKSGGIEKLEYEYEVDDTTIFFYGPNKEIAFGINRYDLFLSNTSGLDFIRYRAKCDLLDNHQHLTRMLNFHLEYIIWKTGKKL